tara:strand:- start:425 stop:910 length:486 start_codon:yes stop_codon:yes gene_type:complete
VDNVTLSNLTNKLEDQSKRFFVIDTNIVLDLWLFQDCNSIGLKKLIINKQVNWVATAAMHIEVKRVLTYSHLVRRLEHEKISATEILMNWEQSVTFVEEASPCSLSCSDSDDQKFIDLAVVNHAVLISKDKAVLQLANQLKILKVDCVLPRIFNDSNHALN